MNRSERLKNRIEDRIQMEGIEGGRLHIAPEKAADRCITFMTLWRCVSMIPTSVTTNLVR